MSLISKLLPNNGERKDDHQEKSPRWHRVQHTDDKCHPALMTNAAAFSDKRSAHCSGTLQAEQPDEHALYRNYLSE